VTVHAPVFVILKEAAHRDDVLSKREVPVRLPIQDAEEGGVPRLARALLRDGGH